MNKVKIENIKTGVVKEVSINLLNDYVGTGEFKVYEEKQKEEKPLFVNNNKNRHNKKRGK